MLATVRAARMLDCWNHADATFAFHEFFPKCLCTSMSYPAPVPIDSPRTKL